jgi:Raf kinase inhibitor-like YbhB/YbcL family protein
MSPRVRAVAGAAGLLLAVGLLGACSDDGREMRPPSPDQTATILTTTTTGPVTTPVPLDPEGGPALSLPWVDGGAIPIDYTCRGANVSPPIVWSALPEGTAEVAIVMTDPGGGNLVHWLVSGLDPSLGQVAQGALPEEAVQSANSQGGVGYYGPCPESGSHLYYVTLYALREPSGLADGGDPATAIARLDELQLASTTQTGTFGGP